MSFKKIFVVCGSLLAVFLLFSVFDSSARNVPILVTPVTSPSMTKASTTTVPVSPQATADTLAGPKTKSLLARFYTLRQNPTQQIFIGQNIGHATDGVTALNTNYKNYIQALYTETGKAPSMLGIDYG
jgi:hypothetical protein